MAILSNVVQYTERLPLKSLNPLLPQNFPLISGPSNSEELEIKELAPEYLSLFC